MDTLKVSTQSRPAAVAGAVAGTIREQGRVEMRAIGAGAVNQAVKAVALARGYLEQEGVQVVCLPAFEQITVDEQERTAIKLTVEKR